MHNHRSVSLALMSILLVPTGMQAGLVINSSSGFTVAWDGNDGDGFNPASPAPVAANLANAAGAVAFTSSDLGPELAIPFHVAGNLNDSLYGNSNSWIGGNLPGGVPAPYAAIKLGGFFNLSSVAFGRDNGNGAYDDSDPGSDCCGGQADDRSLGVYTLQFTRVADPSASTPNTGQAATGWQTIGTLNYQSSDDLIPGGGFTSYLRHEFEIAAGGQPVLATGIRILVPNTGIAGGTDIDEIEIFGNPGVDPDPDGDGFDTALEISLGFDPNSSGSSPEGLSKTEPAVAFSFFGSDNNLYDIEASADLNNWSPLELSLIGPGNKVERCYSIRGEELKFYRAKVVPLVLTIPAIQKP